MAKTIEVSIGDKVLYKGDSVNSAIIRIINHAESNENNSLENISYNLQADKDSFSCSSALKAISCIIAIATLPQ